MELAQKISFDFTVFRDAKYLWWLPSSPYSDEIDWLWGNMPYDDYSYDFEKETLEEEQNAEFDDEDDD